ncbi:hypothetical protein ACWED2_03995 [Amycolatopsis sp. NPDC005003]
MRRGNAMLLAGTCLGAAATALAVAAAVRPPVPAETLPPPALITSVATTATAAPPASPPAELVERVPGSSVCPGTTSSPAGRARPAPPRRRPGC